MNIIIKQETEETDAPPAKIKKCTLNAPTQSLVKLLFDHDMFRDAMKSLDIGIYYIISNAFLWAFDHA